jgi:hypothetical protein
MGTRRPRKPAPEKGPMQPDTAPAPFPAHPNPSSDPVVPQPGGPAPDVPPM